MPRIIIGRPALHFYPNANQTSVAATIGCPVHSLPQNALSHDI